MSEKSEKRESEREGQSLEDFEAQIIGRDMGSVTAGELTQRTEKRGEKVKAVLFVSEGTALDADMDIQVIGIDPAGLQAIVARRC